jgi:hypothetical protein
MTTLWQRINEFVPTDIDGSRVLFCVPTGQYVALNTTAQHIWEALEQPVGEATLVEGLKEAFDVEPEVCVTAVARTVQQLASARLIFAVSS